MSSTFFIECESLHVLMQYNCCNTLLSMLVQQQTLLPSHVTISCFFQLENFQSVLEDSRSVQISFSGAKPPALLAATSFLHCFSARGHTSISEDCSNLSKAVGTIYVSKEVTEERRRALGNEGWRRVVVEVGKGGGTGEERGGWCVLGQL